MRHLAIVMVLVLPCLAAADEGAAMIVHDGADLVLEHTRVEARVEVGLAVVDVRQTFGNPHDVPIDATYVFPLPRDAEGLENRIMVIDGKLFS